MHYYRTYLLIFLYFTAAFRPVVPVWKDAVAHFFNEMEHYARVHQTLGDNHVHHELEKATAEQEESGKRLAPQTDPVPAHWPVYAHCMAHTSPGVLSVYPVLTWGLCSIDLSIQLPPPKAFSFHIQS
jgi:hypothetical protein